MVKKITMIAALIPFLTKPTEKLHLSSIARELGEPRPTVRLWLNALEKEGVLKKSIRGRLTLYAINEVNQAVPDYLVIAEKLKLLELCEKSPMVGEFVSSAQHSLQDSRALIFGSAAESFQSANDIDLLVVGRCDAGAIREKANILGKEAHIIQVKGFQRISRALKNEMVKKHIILTGTEELVRWMAWQK